MDSIARADIFFTVTTVVVVLLGLLLAGILVYILKIVRDARMITKVVKKETENIVSEVQTFRQTIAGDAKKVRDVTGSVIKRATEAVKKRFITKE